ncbi:hypothetical protein FGIG_03783 [Fasciola gigantica]|uniref:Uncharacterized protein n=1 Tax=Fasciola gigantica TaxID=46835 RepID=A0A504YNI5_FASGI|nr:hypothetical protein FGIG_03783 [Fasciola gigantica]
MSKEGYNKISISDILYGVLYVSHILNYLVAFYGRVRDEPVDFARGGFITVCGLGGVILGYKGGILRKMLYATMSASLATAACYPSATLHYSRTAWEHSKQRIGALKDEFYRKVSFISLSLKLSKPCVSSITWHRNVRLPYFKSTAQFLRPAFFKTNDNGPWSTSRMYPRGLSTKSA